MEFILDYDPESKTTLWMPEYFVNASAEEILKAIGRGGCGPGGFGDKIVPDTIFGLNVHPACKRHDMSWYLAKNEAERVLSDAMFLCNLLRLNDASENNKFFKWLRLNSPFGIYHYYEAVAYLGFSPDYTSNKDIVRTI